MSLDFDLLVTADAKNYSADFRLLDEHGIQAAYRHTDGDRIRLIDCLPLMCGRN
jgi:hypothetical protein